MASASRPWKVANGPGSGITRAVSAVRWSRPVERSATPRTEFRTLPRLASAQAAIVIAPIEWPASRIGWPSNAAASSTSARSAASASSE